MSQDIDELKELAEIAEKDDDSKGRLLNMLLNLKTADLPEEISKAVIDISKCENVAFRKKVIRVFEKYGMEDELIEMLKARNGEVRIATIRAIGAIGTEKSFKTLTENYYSFYKNQEPKEILKAMRRIIKRARKAGLEKFSADVMRVLEYSIYTNGLQFEAATTLCYSDGREAYEKIKSLIERGDENLKKAILNTIKEAQPTWGKKIIEKYSETGSDNGLKESGDTKRMPAREEGASIPKYTAREV